MKNTQKRDGSADSVSETGFDSSNLILQPNQKQMLRALVDIYREKQGVVKGREIGQRVDRNPGTIRNQMQSLKALRLVEGVPGPKGGYRPTAEAYTVLNIEALDDAKTIPITRNGQPVESVDITDIDFVSIHHPTLCRTKIHLMGDIGQFTKMDEIEVGPLSVSNLVITATVENTDRIENVLLCRIDGMTTRNS